MVATMLAAGVIGFFLGSLIYNSETERAKNLLAFDGDPALRARVDGIDVGALATTKANTTIIPNWDSGGSTSFPSITR